jgi:uncharacterized protein Yka (UPF0111/DUF47 family)
VRSQGTSCHEIGLGRYLIQDPLVVFHMIRLVEIMADVADHAQSASDRMRSMIVM